MLLFQLCCLPWLCVVRRARRLTICRSLFSCCLCRVVVSCPWLQTFLQRVRLGLGTLLLLQLRLLLLLLLPPGHRLPLQAVTLQLLLLPLLLRLLPRLPSGSMSR